jgi:hypothetical protein
LSTSIRRILAVDRTMRLIFKKWDSAFDPVVTIVGVGFVFVGAYCMALLRHALQHPVVLVVAAIPTLVAVIGVVIVVREVQLFRRQ